MTEPDAPRYGTGILFAVGAYGLWGLLPLYFLLLKPAGAFEIVSWRIVLSLVFCALLVAVTRGWQRLVALLRDRRIMLTMGAAGVLILINWLTYVFATLAGEVVQAALGYFMNPIVTVLLGVFVLREKLRPLQWIAIGISLIAVVVLAINYGAIPWIAIALAVSFGLYGLLKKRVGARVDALSGLTIETLWLAPFAAALLIVLAATGRMALGAHGTGHTVALLSAGAVTAIPLLLFAGGARRLPLTYMGLAQYIAPVLQFLLAVFVLHEAMPAERWIGFSIVWVALAVLTVDMFIAGGTSRRAIRRLGHDRVTLQA